MVVGLHVLAQLVKGLVVVLFTQVRQFMYHDHAQQRLGQAFEDGGDLNFVLALEIAALHAADELMLAQGVIDDVHAGIKEHFADRITAPHELLFDALGVIVQGGVGLDQVLSLRRVASFQPGTELAPVNQLLDLLLQAGAVSAQVLKRGHSHSVLPVLERLMIQDSRRLGLLPLLAAQLWPWQYTVDCTRGQQASTGHARDLITAVGRRVDHLFDQD